MGNHDSYSDSNAVKFTPREGRVDVWLGRVGALLHMRVSDTGQGISREFLPHVFERFRRADGTQRRIHGGLGLGLAIVKELVELHGGTVDVDSPGEGLGSTFTVALPVPPLLMEPTDAEADVPRETSGEAARAAMDRTLLEGLRLRVVEDEPDSREMRVAVFEQCGATVSAAASAAEALEALRQAMPALLVCDIGLPGEDGHELIRTIRAVESERSGCRMPALALTAYAGADHREKAVAAGFDAHLPKPVAPAELVARVACCPARVAEAEPRRGVYC